MRQYVLSPHIVWLWYDQERLVSAGPSMWSRAGYSATHFPVAEAWIIRVNMSLNVCVCASFRVCLTTVWWSVLILANSLLYVSAFVWSFCQFIFFLMSCFYPNYLIDCQPTVSKHHTLRQAWVPYWGSNAPIQDMNECYVTWEWVCQGSLGLISQNK